MKRAASLFALLLALPGAAPANADDAADFFRNRPLRLVSGSAVSESTTIYERLLARFLPKYLPGNPTMTAESMPGAGGLTAANMVANVAPRDGSVIGTAHGFVPLMPLFGMEGPRFDPGQLYYLGAMYRLTGLCIGMKRDGIDSVEDLRRREVLVGTSGPGTEIITFYNTLQQMVGAKLKVIRGYASSAHINLAMERGELQARCGISWSSMKISKPGWAAGEVVNILMQLRLEKDAALPNTPLLGDWVTNPKDRAALAVLMASPELGYPVFLPPGVPAERAQALRRGFGLVMNDPDFAAELARQQLDLSRTDGAAMQAAIAALYRTPADIVARVRDLAVAREAK